MKNIMDDKNRTDIKVTALISLYTNISSEIEYYQNQGDSTVIINTITIVIVPILNVFGATNQIISIVALLAPIVQLISLQRGLQAHTFVAVLRGYSAYIEEEINVLIEANAFLYNSKLIDKYIAKQTISKNSKMKISWFVTILMHIAVLLVCVFFFVISNLRSPWHYFLIAGLIFLFYGYQITKLCIAFCKKEEKRSGAKQFCKDLNNKVK